ncbi:MAG: Fic family protein [Candidatus Hydrogenedens sp.]|jgi:Fic family protein|nr:Fic family protein [Candidatus Hydrogenedens sp.]
MVEKFEPDFTITNEITAGLTQIERARGFLEGAVLSEEWVQAMRQRALVLEAHHTTHIEGTQLSLAQAKDLLDGSPVGGTDPDDVQELLNYRDAFDFVSEYLESEGPITEGLIREIHKRLVQNVRGGAASPGDYRKVPNYVVSSATGNIIYTPPPAHDVALMMRSLVDWLNQEKEVHPVLISGIAQFQLVHIHPFLDGNGRCSRLLSTLYLYRAGYDFKRLFTISEFYDRDRPAFYEALQSIRETNMDMTAWLEYYVRGLTVQLSELRARSERAIRQQFLTEEHRLSDRQAIALGHILEHDLLTIQEFEVLCPDVNRRTLQRDLKAMVDADLLLSEGSTNNLRYCMKPAP